MSENTSTPNAVSDSMPVTPSLTPPAATSTKTLSLWRAPELSMRWWPVFLRNLLVWRKLAIPSLVGNIADPLIALVAFGYGLGALVGDVKLGGVAVPYVVYLGGGYICTSAMNAASF